jgi:hypothetical protein
MTQAKEIGVFVTATIIILGAFCITLGAINNQAKKKKTMLLPSTYAPAPPAPVRAVLNEEESSSEPKNGKLKWDLGTDGGMWIDEEISYKMISQLDKK